MAVVIKIKPIGIFKKRMDINQIIACTGLSYGICDENYRLISNETGEHTLLYDATYLARGIDVSFHQDEIILQLSLPTGIHEIECFYEIVEKISNYLKKVEITRDDELFDLSKKNIYIDCDIDGSLHGLEMILDELNKGDSAYLQLFGIIQPLSIGIKEIKQINGNLNKFEKWLNDLQTMDVYYAAPKVYKINDMLIGIYAIGPEIESVVPTKPYIIMNQIEGIEKWYVILEGNKTIRYENFIEHVEKKYYDANHVVVNLSKEETISLISQYEEEL